MSIEVGSVGSGNEADHRGCGELLANANDEPDAEPSIAIAETVEFADPGRGGSGLAGRRESTPCSSTGPR